MLDEPRDDQRLIGGGGLKFLRKAKKICIRMLENSVENNIIYPYNLTHVTFVPPKLCAPRRELNSLHYKQRLHMLKPHLAMSWAVTLAHAFWRSSAASRT